MLVAREKLSITDTYNVVPLLSEVGATRCIFIKVLGINCCIERRALLVIFAYPCSCFLFKERTLCALVYATEELGVCARVFAVSELVDEWSMVMQATR